MKFLVLGGKEKFSFIINCDTERILFVYQFTFGTTFAIRDFVWQPEMNM